MGFAPSLGVEATGSPGVRRGGPRPGALGDFAAVTGELRYSLEDHAGEPRGREGVDRAMLLIAWLDSPRRDHHAIGRAPHAIGLDGDGSGLDGDAIETLRMPIEA
ncbi:MAG: hypothetical protein ACYDCL_21175 [Myxococcales bacterium]